MAIEDNLFSDKFAMKKQPSVQNMSSSSSNKFFANQIDFSSLMKRDIYEGDNDI